MSKVKINNPNSDVVKGATSLEYYENTYASPIQNKGFISRYQQVPLVFDTKAGCFVHSNLFNFYIPCTDKDMFITTGYSERLDILAQKYYNNSTFWWIIAVANHITDPFDIPVGLILRIPPISALTDRKSITSGVK